MAQSTTIQKLLQHTQQLLLTITDEREARNMARWLLQDRLNLHNSTDLVLKARETVHHAKVALVERDLEALLKGTPLQYVLGKAPFCDIVLSVNESVLIPRPETEELVYLVLDTVNKGASTLRMLDVGTGSACIALALKDQWPNADIWAVDLSPEALEVAALNAKELELPISLKVFNALKDEDWEQLPIFDVVVSNPPYIPKTEGNHLEKHVRDYEPAMALYSPDENPAVFYKTILSNARARLSPRGWVFLELNPDFAEEVLTFAEQLGYNALIQQDLQGRKRILKAQYK